METINSYDSWIGTDAYDVNGDKIGAIDAIYYDDQTDHAEWMAIRTGFFGLNTSVVPIAGGTVRDGQLHLPYSKDQVKNAPNFAPNGHLTAGEERELFDHYGFAWDAPSYGVGERFDSEYDVTQPTRTEADVAETTRSEEELRVGTEKVATGNARLRKYVVTEHQNVTVPVTREEVRVERGPITNGEADDIGDDEAAVTTFAERPVVSTEEGGQREGASGQGDRHRR
jgi:stress response protein YsnF